MIYLDSSALIKLVHRENETEALRAWLEEQAESPVISSVVARIEVIRACRRYTRSALETARRLIAGLDLIPLAGDVVDLAGRVGRPQLRSLDAIHLASALSVRSGLTAFCAYDIRLRAAAEAADLRVLAPGG